MRRNFIVGALICAVPTALAAVLVALAFDREAAGQAGFRRGIDLAGGTILVYEVNLERSMRQRDSSATAEGLSPDEIKRLAENLKRRIDPNDLQNVIVRPVGRSRVEIILPFTTTTGGGSKGDKQANTVDFVQEVKAKVRQVGVLEFRILANATDDRDGIADAQALLDKARTDPKVKADLEQLAKAGRPPLASTGEYTVPVNGQIQDGVRYEWVELGKEERDSYGVSNIHATEAPQPRPGLAAPRWLYPEMEKARQADGGAQAKAGVVMPFEGGLLFTRDYTAERPVGDEGKKKAEYFLLTRVSPADAFRVTREYGMTARSSEDQQQRPAVGFGFNSAGNRRFGALTDRNRPDTQTDFKRRLAIVLDEKIISAPTLNSALPQGGIISGNFDQAAVNRMVYLLKSGALNAELKPDPVSENSVGPTLGQDTIRKGLAAVGLAFAAVLAFMVVYYRFSGVVACIALFVNLLLTVGFMVSVNAAFTLPGLAGIVLMLGMAVDANVLIYERIREEREKGANLLNAVRLGYDRAFSTIIDTHLTSIFTCIVLYAFGNDNLKGFSISLTVGLIISLFTALYLTRLMFDYWLQRRWLTTLRMMKLFARPSFDFMAIRRPMFALTAGLTVAGLALMWHRGDSVLNVDFTKGTAYGGRLAEGQERALNDTDKKGFLTLLGEAAQRDRLQVQDVVWLGRGAEGEARQGGDYVYQITYADGTKANVTFVNAPDGDTEAEQKADVVRRAAGLPGISVEQVYTGDDAGKFSNNKSAAFTVRTTEKEPELVQVGLDRLLRDEASGAPLLATTKVTDVKVDGTAATLTLDRPASPRYLAGFVERELKLGGRWPAIGQGAGVEVAGVPSTDPVAAAEEQRTGQFSTIRVGVGSNPEFRALKEALDTKKPINIDPAAKGAQAAFQTVLDQAKAAFEARPIPDRLETFDPALAADTRNKAFYAVVASWAAVLVFLWFRFGNWTFGLAAVICLIHDLAFTLGAIALCHYLYDNPFGQLLQLHDFKIDLAAVAALLTLVGYSVNDTIVVFDRIREVRGKNPALTAQMINDSVNQTLSRTVLASLTVFLVVGVLYWFGGEGIHLFSFVMVIGVVVGTYSSIYIAAPLLLIFGEGQPKVDPRFPNRQPAALAR